MQRYFLLYTAPGLSHEAYVRLSIMTMTDGMADVDLALALNCGRLTFGIL